MVCESPRLTKITARVWDNNLHTMYESEFTSQADAELWVKGIFLIDEEAQGFDYH